MTSLKKPVVSQSASHWLMFLKPSAEVIFRVDQCHYLSTCTSTPQLHSTDNKLGLIFFRGGVGAQLITRYCHWPWKSRIRLVCQSKVFQVKFGVLVDKDSLTKIVKDFEEVIIQQTLCGNCLCQAFIPK